MQQNSFSKEFSKQNWSLSVVFEILATEYRSGQICCVENFVFFGVFLMLIKLKLLCISLYHYASCCWLASYKISGKTFKPLLNYGNLYRGWGCFLDTIIIFRKHLRTNYVVVCAVCASMVLIHSISWYHLLTRFRVGKSTRPQHWKRVSLQVVLNHWHNWREVAYFHLLYDIAEFLASACVVIFSLSFK